VQALESGSILAEKCSEKGEDVVNDAIHQPAHYKAGGIETIAYIKAKLTPEQYQGYLVGNVIKYISRYRHKNGAEDLKKARVYLNWLIEEMEGDHARQN